jgi:hypothetical protein
MCTDNAVLVGENRTPALLKGLDDEILLREFKLVVVPQVMDLRSMRAIHLINLIKKVRIFTSKAINLRRRGTSPQRRRAHHETALVPTSGAPLASGNALLTAIEFLRRGCALTK